MNTFEKEILNAATEMFPEYLEEQPIIGFTLQDLSKTHPKQYDSNYYFNLKKKLKGFFTFSSFHSHEEGDDAVNS